MTSTDNLNTELGRRWAALAPREQLLVAAMGAALAFLVVWLAAVRPALRTLDQAPALRAQADLQLLQVQALAAEAKELRALPPLPPGQAQQALKAATDPLGARAKVAVVGDKATLTLTGASGEDLRQWLEQARNGARVRPVEANLTRVGSGYNGTVVVSLGGE